MNQQVQARALQLMAVMKLLLNNQQDIFPGFFQFLNKLQAKGNSNGDKKLHRHRSSTIRKQIFSVEKNGCLR
jgi:hypothetical protein